MISQMILFPVLNNVGYVSKNYHKKTYEFGNVSQAGIILNYKSASMARTPLGSWH